MKRIMENTDTKMKKKVRLLLPAGIFAAAILVIAFFILNNQFSVNACSASDSNISTSLKAVESAKTGTDAAPIDDGQSKQAGAALEFKPKVTVPYDLKTEEAAQKSVDEGHSPWRLDPLFVAQVFVSLMISPGGITGDYPIKYEDLKVIFNKDGKAVIKVNSSNSPVSRVYLRQLVKQDPTGIWTVVGYDPAG